MARRSQELGINVNSNSNIEQFQGGGYRPQAPTKFQGPSVADQGLAGLMSLGEQVAEQKFNQQAEEAYLKGGIAAAQGQSAESVNSDPFVAPFVNGGYNDENYRLVQTKETFNFQNWMAKEGHRYAPDDPRVTEALHKASDNTMAAITPNMTARGRAEALMSQNKTNEALITQHNKAYKDWSVKEAARRILPQGNQIQAMLVRAMNDNDHATYQATMDKAALYYTDIGNNAELPEDMRADISRNFLSALINADQREPVEQMRQAGLLDTLPFEDREKLDTELRESENRTQVKDLGNKIATNSFFEQGAAEGDYSVPQIEAYVQQGYKDGWMTLPHAMSLFDQAAKGRSNKKKTADIIGALNRRQLSGVGGLYELGSSVPDGMDILEKQLRANGVQDVERVGTMVGIGLDLGYIPKTNAEVIGQAVRAIGAAKPDQPVNPDFINTLNLTTSLVHTAGKTAPYKAQILLESMPEDTKGAMAYVIQQAEYGKKPEESLRNFWANNAAIKALPDTEKQRHTIEWRKKYGSAINKEFPRSFYGTFFKGLVGEAQRIDDSALSDNQILTSVWSEMRYQEANPNNLGVPEDALVAIASSNVRSRVIPITDGGELSKATPLILERGVDVESMFGTKDRPTIGHALAKAYPAANENVKSIFVWDPVNKQVINKQVDENFNSVGETAVDSNKLKAAITEERRVREEAESAVNFGSLRKVGDNLITIDGRNSAGVTPNVAFAMRDLLVKAQPDVAEALMYEQRSDKPGSLKPLTKDGQVLKTAEGRQVNVDDKGNFVTEFSITVTEPGLNGGKPTNIPSVYNGKYVSDEEAINIAIQNKGVDPETGRKLEAYSSIAEAETAARARTASLGQQLKGANKVSSNNFRDNTDLMIARTVRHIAPAYINVKAQAAIAATVAIQGSVATDKIISAATKAIDARDENALREALSKVTNETIRNELLKSLPNGRIETGTDVPFSAGFSNY